MSLIRVERLNSNSSGNKPRSLWLVWVGEQFLELKDIWSQYACRTCGELCAFVLRRKPPRGRLSPNGGTAFQSPNVYGLHFQGLEHLPVETIDKNGLRG